MYALGLTIDPWMNAARGMWVFAASLAGVVSRSGPIVPVEPAGLKVWQEPQPLAANTALPFAALAAAAGAVVVAAVVAAGEAAVVWAVVVWAVVAAAAVVVAGAFVCVAAQPTVTVRSTVFPLG